MSMKSFAGLRSAAIAGTLAVAAITGCVLARGIASAQPAPNQIQDVYNFTGGSDGAFPVGSLIQLPNGRMVGQTCASDTFRGTLPTVFTLGPDGSVSTLFTFAADGSQGTSCPLTLFQASDGNLYGANCEGGEHTLGVAFRLSLSGVFTKLLDFDGTTACGQYTEGFDGALYSTSQFGGGPNNTGAITRTTLDGKTSFVYSFGPFQAGASTPLGPLALAPDGTLYGITEYYAENGPVEDGCVFKADAQGNFRVIYIFAGGPIQRGSVPPVLANDGFLYFVSPTGGSSPACQVEAGCGSIYRMASDGSEAAIVYSFTGGSDGGAPGSLIQGSDGKFYGTARLSSPGAIFQFDPASGSLISYPFPQGLLAPYSPLLQALGGTLFGDTGSYGSPEAGAVFSLKLGLPATKPAILSFRPQTGSAGTLVTVWGSNFVGVTGVSVNGSPSKFRNTASGFVSFTVPEGAASGRIAITTPGGTAVSSGSFAVN